MNAARGVGVRGALGIDLFRCDRLGSPLGSAAGWWLDRMAARVQVGFVGPDSPLLPNPAGCPVRQVSGSVTERPSPGPAWPAEAMGSSGAVGGYSERAQAPTLLAKDRHSPLGV